MMEVYQMESIKDKWKEYCFREVMGGDRTLYIKRQFMNINSPQYAALRDLTDVHHSIRKYTEDALDVSPDRLWEVDSVSALFFDLDGHASSVTMVTLIQATAKLCSWLMKKLDLTENEIFVWWSGRGFHISIPGEVLFADPTPSPENDFRLFADWVQREAGIYAQIKNWQPDQKQIHHEKIKLLDNSIYFPRAMIRIPGSKNSKSRYENGLRKVRIPIDNLKRLASSSGGIDMSTKLGIIAKGSFWSDEAWV